MYAPTWKLKKFQELYIRMFALAQGQDLRKITKKRRRS